MIDIALIRIDGGTQSRVSLNENVVEEYAEAYRCGAKFPPVTVYYDGVERWLADGFHRYFAAKKAGLTEIYETIELGTKEDAIIHSLGVNGTHGLQRTNADKTKSVTTALGLKKLKDASSRELARLCGVSHTFVEKVRLSLATVAISPLHPAPMLERTFTNQYGTESKIIVKPKEQPVEKAEEFSEEDCGPSEAELQEAFAEEEAETAQKIAKQSLIESLIDSDEPLADLSKKFIQVEALNRVLESRNNGLMNTVAAYAKIIKSRDNQIAKLKKELAAK